MFERVSSGFVWIRLYLFKFYIHPRLAAGNYIHPALNSAGFRPGEPQRLEMLQGTAQQIPITLYINLLQRIYIYSPALKVNC
jgi:hypothetical protein